LLLAILANPDFKFVTHWWIFGGIAAAALAERPPASTAVMLAIGDALALVLMELKGFTREDYGLRHHGGYLGQLARSR